MHPRSKPRSTLARQNRLEVASCEARAWPHASHSTEAWLSWAIADPGVSNIVMSNRPDFAR